MKSCLILLFLLFIYLVGASNVCLHTPVTCVNVANCDVGCTGLLATLLSQRSTVDDVWQGAQEYLGGLWTVIQTQDANCYSNWGTAATCTCAGVDIVNIFVQQ